MCLIINRLRNSLWARGGAHVGVALKLKETRVPVLVMFLLLFSLMQTLPVRGGLSSRIFLVLLLFGWGTLPMLFGVVTRKRRMGSYTRQKQNITVNFSPCKFHQHPEVIWGADLGKCCSTASSACRPWWCPLWVDRPEEAPVWVWPKEKMEGQC